MVVVLGERGDAPLRDGLAVWGDHHRYARDRPALPVAEHIQLICTTSFVIVSITMILTGTMRAYGAVVAPLVIMFLGLYPGRLGFYFVSRPMLDSEAVWWAYPVGSVLTVALTLGYYRFGKWRDAFRM